MNFILGFTKSVWEGFFSMIKGIGFLLAFMIALWAICWPITGVGMVSDYGMNPWFYALGYIPWFFIVGKVYNS
jgi:hypothetical protein